MTPTALSKVFVLTDRPLLAFGIESACKAAGLSYGGSDVPPDAALHGTSMLVVDAERNEVSSSRLGRRRVPVMLIVPRHPSARVRDELGRGILGAVTTDDALSTVADGLVHLTSGRAFVSSRAATLLFAALEQDSVRPVQDAAASLSSRELEVLQAMADGLSTRAIAERLGVTPKTIEAHSSRIFRRLNASSRTEAVARMMTTGRLRSSLPQT